jgi:nucleoside phosphorylase
MSAESVPGTQLKRSAVGIVIATRWEAGLLLKALHFNRMESGLYRTVISGRTVWLCISGVGMAAARAAAMRLCAKGVGELISSGFCGALTADLKVGDIVTDRIVTLSVPARTPEERAAAASRGAQAVDMETKAVVEAGTRSGIPVRILRVVSDEVNDDMTPLFGRGWNFSLLRVALRLLNPAVWPLANRLRKNSALAKKRLVEAITQYLSK